MNNCKEIKHYIKNNELDLEKIINEYSSYTATIIDNMARNSLKDEDKEEIVSEVFFILWKNKNKLNINKYLSSYIAGITRNVVKEYLRKAKINFDISDYENSLYNYDKIDLLDDNVEEISKIEKKLKNMKKIDKTIFLDFYYSSKSIKDIAKEQKISEFSVKQRLYRIRNKIRKEGKEMDNNKIFEKVKMKIAISNVKEEDIVMNKRKLNIGKGIGIAACITLSITGVVFATTQIINKFGANSSDGIQTAIENGYYSDINTEYKEANGISTSIESFLIDSDNFDINFNIKFDDSYSLQDMLANDGKIDIMDLKVVNEKNEKVFATRELETEEIIALHLTEQDARDKYDSYNGSYSETSQKVNNNEIRYYLTATGNPVEFPVSQKLKVTFNKIRNRYWENGKEKYRIYEGEWSYEIDVPSKMAQSNIVQYKLVSISDESYKFDSARVSNTAFKIYLSNCNGIAHNENECVETSDGRKFYPAGRSDGDGMISVKEDGIVRYYNTFNLTNYDATDNLKVHLFKENGDEIIVDLTKER